MFLSSQNYARSLLMVNKSIWLRCNLPGRYSQILVWVYAYFWSCGEQRKSKPNSNLCFQLVFILKSLRMCAEQFKDIIKSPALPWHSRLWWLHVNSDHSRKSISLALHYVAFQLYCTVHTAAWFRVAPRGVLHSLVSLRVGEVQIDLAFHCTECWVTLHTVTGACTNRHAWNMWRQTYGRVENYFARSQKSTASSMQFPPSCVLT